MWAMTPALILMHPAGVIELLTWGLRPCNTRTERPMYHRRRGDSFLQGVPETAGAADLDRAVAGGGDAQGGVRGDALRGRFGDCAINGKQVRPLGCRREHPKDRGPDARFAS